MTDARKGDLTTSELLVLQSEIRRAERSLGLAYLMLLGGHLGIHRFYMRRFKSGSMQLALFLVVTIAYFAMIVVDANSGSSGMAALVALLFVAVPGLALFVWIIADLFLLPKMVREWNRRAEEDLIREIVRIRGMKNANGGSAVVRE